LTTVRWEDAAVGNHYALRREGEITMSKTASKQVMPIIAVESVDEIRSFYIDTLGFDHVMGVVGKDGEFDFCTVVKDGARIMFARAPGRPRVAKREPRSSPSRSTLRSPMSSPTTIRSRRRSPRRSPTR